MKWRILIYFAGDNDLDSTGALVRDLWALEKIGPSADVEVWFQLDGLDNGLGVKGTKRFKLRKTNKKQSEWSSLDSLLIEDLGELNTGDPQVLADFLVWGLSEKNFDRVALILWGHGSGALDIPLNVLGVRDYLGRIEERLFFKSLANKYINQLSKTGAPMSAADVRAIAVDFTSNMDALENAELSNSIRRALEETQSDIFDMIVFDACFMGSIELIFEIADLTHIALVSAATVPNQGMPYDKLLGVFSSASSSGIVEIGNKLVDAFDIDYRTDNWFVKTPITLACVKTEEIEVVVSTLEKFANELFVAAGKSEASRFLVHGAVRASWGQIVERFGDKNFVDLQKLLNRISQNETLINQGVTNGQDIITTEMMSKVVSSRVSRIRRDYPDPPPEIDASGITIHFPASPIALENLGIYLRSNFSQLGAPSWRNLLEQFD